MSAPGLHIAATQWRRTQELIDEETHLLTHLTHELGDAGSGDGFDALIHRIGELKNPLSLRGVMASEIATVLAITAELQGMLDEAVSRIEPFVDSQPWAGALLRQLSTLGEVLDAACARHIDLVCTPALPESEVSLSAYPDLPVDALHELAYLQAPPEVQALVNDNDDVQLLEVGPGTMAAVVGDLEAADTVTTFVAGVNSSEMHTWPTQIERGRVLAEAVTMPGRSSATVVWLGYSAPGDLVRGTQKEPARRGAATLRRFQRALSERYPHQRRIVTGYSYGTVVAAEAATHGLHADDLVLVGSPGVPARGVEDLTLLGEDPRIFAVTSPNDPIGLITSARGGVHGPDPAEAGFGATPIASGYRGDHLGYLEDPGFLRGYGEAVHRD